MKSFIVNIRKPWFEARIFISLSIITGISLISFLCFREYPSCLEIAGRWFKLPGYLAIGYGYFFVAFMLTIASLLRMWAGSILTSETVMAFRIRNNKMEISGPYNFVRNPIYFADLMAFSSLSLCLTPIGLAIPLLIRLHYYQLIKYEEEKLLTVFGHTYEKFMNSVPCLFPGIKEIKKLFSTSLNFRLNFDGIRHNAQYVLFIPGLICASFSGEFILAVLIGLPAVIDWAVIHTIIGISPDKHRQGKAGNKTLGHSRVFNDILYSQCWEDPEMDRLAFNIKSCDTVFSITSGGCNALTFLLDNPQKIICLDMNRFQNYLLRLKISAFRVLEYRETLEFFGIIPSRRRWEFYERLKPLLTEEEQLYWEGKKQDINNGIIHCGKYERYMHLLKNIFRLLLGKKIINELFNTTTLDEQRKLFCDKWDTFRWRLFCSIFLSRPFASLFFDKAFYRYLDPSFSFEKYYRSAVRNVISELPVRQNYFLSYILSGNYLIDNLPSYLKPENYFTIRERSDRIEIVTSGCHDYLRSLPTNTISKFNFTNIFEWMSMEEFTLLMLEIVRISRDGAVLTYRNHLITRTRPEIFAAQVIPDTRLSDDLRRTDRSFIYKAYVVERIKKNICQSL
jgi:S-adenosylmethionine-diacylglycerol 3-amino-3-carboxypropyl transferase